jgi:transposase
MPHANARLTIHGRNLLITRVVHDHRSVAHIAKELGVFRQGAHLWVNRYRAEGPPGLVDRSSRPKSPPSRMSAEQEDRVLAAREKLRAEPLRIAAAAGVPAGTVSRMLVRHEIPRLAWCDPMTTPASPSPRSTATRKEQPPPEC